MDWSNLFEIELNKVICWIVYYFSFCNFIHIKKASKSLKKNSQKILKKEN